MGGVLHGRNPHGTADGTWCLLRHLLPDNLVEHRPDDNVVVQPDAHDQDHESNRRHPVKGLPSDNEREGPDEDLPDVVQNGTGRGAQLFGHCYSCKVKHGNGEHVADGPAENAGAVENLAEPIDSVFKPVFWSKSKGLSGIDKVEWPQQDSNGGESKNSFISDHLERGQIVLGEVNLFIDKLEGVENLSNNNDDISGEGVGSKFVGHTFFPVGGGFRFRGCSVIGMKDPLINTQISLLLLID